MKAYDEPIAVETRKGWPQTIQWRRSTYSVEKVIDYWVLQTKWWVKDEKRVYFQVACGRSILEIYKTDGEWTLAKVVD